MRGNRRFPFMIQKNPTHCIDLVIRFGEVDPCTCIDPNDRRACYACPLLPGG